VKEVLSGHGLREKAQTPFMPYRIPTGVPYPVARERETLLGNNVYSCVMATVTVSLPV